jgi:hypothetical protein
MLRSILSALYIINQKLSISNILCWMLKKQRGSDNTNLYTLQIIIYYLHANNIDTLEFFKIKLKNIWLWLILLPYIKNNIENIVNVPLLRQC